MNELCPCMNPRLLNDGSCGQCRRRCIGVPTPEMDAELADALGRVAMGLFRPSLKGRKLS